MLLKTEDVEKILNGETPVCNYVTMQAIINYLLKMKSFPAGHSFTLEEMLLLRKELVAFLDKHKFFSLSRK